MTNDELLSRLVKQSAELQATRLALDALMTALPGDLQQLWLQALRTQTAIRAATLGHSGVAATTATAQVDAMAGQLQRLEHAQGALKRADGAN